MCDIYRAYLYAFNGLKIVSKEERAFKQEVAISAVLFILLFYLKLDLLDKVIMGFSLGIVLVTELLNSAIEATVDLVTSEYHDLAKKAKDIASTAVLVSIIMCICVWGVLLLR